MWDTRVCGVLVSTIEMVQLSYLGEFYESTTCSNTTPNQNTYKTYAEWFALYIPLLAIFRAISCSLSKYPNKCQSVKFTTLFSFLHVSSLLSNIHLSTEHMRKTAWWGIKDSACLIRQWNSTSNELPSLRSDKTNKCDLNV